MGVRLSGIEAPASALRNCTRNETRGHTRGRVRGDPAINPEHHRRQLRPIWTRRRCGCSPWRPLRGIMASNWTATTIHHGGWGRRTLPSVIGEVVARPGVGCQGKPAGVGAVAPPDRGIGHRAWCHRWSCCLRRRDSGCAGRIRSLVSQYRLDPRSAFHRP